MSTEKLLANFEHGLAEFPKKMHIFSGKGNGYMRITFDEMRKKEVINLKTGSCFGFADDIVIDTETREVKSLIMRGRRYFFGLLGREEDTVINWKEIETIGMDTILVQIDEKRENLLKKENIFQKFLNFFL